LWGGVREKEEKKSAYSFTTTMSLVDYADEANENEGSECV